VKDWEQILSGKEYFMGKRQKPAQLWLDDGETLVAGDALTSMLDSLYGGGPQEREAASALASLYRTLSELEAATLYYDVVTGTPLGPIYIAIGGEGIVALGFDDSEEAFLKRMVKRHGSSIERSMPHVELAAKQLKDYFAGKRGSFDLPLDLRSLTPFQKAVLTAIQQLPPGSTISYSGLARRIGKPGAARAVGRALGSNPIPIIIPCHRALAADGSLGGYSGRGGVRTKEALLTLEGAL
jgi:methylated-DNA-[protein]-cysteine S-methyltransferase